MHWDIGSVQDSVANELPHILFWLNKNWQKF